MNRRMVQSELAPIQAFRIAGNLVGVEFHPEIDLRTVRHLNQIGVRRLNDFGARSARDQATAHRRYAQQNTTRLRAALVRWLAH
jgi:GMP synthase-like glutamine amidotransferase